MRRKIIFVSLLLLLPSLAWAGLNNLPAMYGILPADIGTAGCRAAGYAEAAAYYNPAALADIEHHQLTNGYLYAQPFFRGGLRGAERDFDSPNRVLLLGMALDIGRMFNPDYALGMGMNFLVDDNFQTIVNFRDWRYPQGRFIMYGVRGFTMIHSIGLRVVRGFNFGAGYLLGQSSSVHLDQQIKISGSIQNEQMELTGSPVFIPIVALQVVIEPVKVGLTYHARMVDIVDPVTADTAVVIYDEVFQEYKSYLNFKDGYVPQHLALGVELFPQAAWSIAAQLEWHEWSHFTDEIEHCDAARQGIYLRTHDTYIPRLAATGRLSEHWEIRAGYAFEQTPFYEPGGQNNLVLDNDRHRVAAGAGLTL
ncbi:MAG: outer membrane protein transport protein, partial [Alphaproteobacteria bacterium]